MTNHSTPTPLPPLLCFLFKYHLLSSAKSWERTDLIVLFFCVLPVLLIHGDYKMRPKKQLWATYFWTSVCTDTCVQKYTHTHIYREIHKHAASHKWGRARHRSSCCVDLLIKLYVCVRDALSSSEQVNRCFLYVHVLTEQLSFACMRTSHIAA